MENINNNPLTNQDELKITFSRGISDFLEIAKDLLDSTLENINQLKQDKKIQKEDINPDLNKLPDIIYKTAKKLMKFSRDFYLLTEIIETKESRGVDATENEAEENLDMSLDLKRWKPICFNDTGLMKQQGVFHEDSIERYYLIKNAILSNFKINSSEKSISKCLNSNKKMKLYKAFDIEIFFERQNGENVTEIYRGGWNSKGHKHGRGVLYRLENDRNIFQAYRGDFVDDKMKGFCMMFNFEEEEKRTEMKNLKFTIFSGFYDDGKFLDSSESRRVKYTPKDEERFRVISPDDSD